MNVALWCSWFFFFLNGQTTECFLMGYLFPFRCGLQNRDSSILLTILVLPFLIPLPPQNSDLTKNYFLRDLFNLHFNLGDVIVLDSDVMGYTACFKESSQRGLFRKQFISISTKNTWLLLIWTYVLNLLLRILILEAQLLQNFKQYYRVQRFSSVCFVFPVFEGS